MKRISTEIKWAGIFVCMMLIWMLLERLTGLHDKYIHLHPYLTNMVAIPAIIIYFMALRDKREKDLGGKMTYLQGFKSGLLITLFVTLLSPFSQFLTSVIITPNFFLNAIRYSVSNNYMTLSEAEAYFSVKNYIIQGLIGAPLRGLVTTSIVAIFTRKK